MTLDHISVDGAPEGSPRHPSQFCLWRRGHTSEGEVSQFLVVYDIKEVQRTNVYLHNVYLHNINLQCIFIYIYIYCIYICIYVYIYIICIYITFIRGTMTSPAHPPWSQAPSPFSAWCWCQIYLTLFIVSWIHRVEPSCSSICDEASQSFPLCA